MLTSVALVKQELLQRNTATNRDSSYDESAIRRALPQALQRIERHCRREFVPRIATRNFAATTLTNGGAVKGSTLYLEQHLLSASAVTVSDTAISSPSYSLQPGNDESAGAICLTDGTTWRAYVSNTTTPKPISISGTWAYHRHVSEAWADSLDAIPAGGMLANATTLTVDNAAGEDSLFFAPRFSPGNILKVNDELMLVAGVTDNTLSVQRGYNGSTADAHGEGDTIYKWQTDYEIERAATRWVANLYKRQGSFETVRVEGMTEIRFPKDMPDDVRADLAPFVRLPIEQFKAL